MIAEISSPSTGSNDSEFGKETWRYFEKFPSPVYLRSSISNGVAFALMGFWGVWGVWVNNQIQLKSHSKGRENSKFYIYIYISNKYFHASLINSLSFDPVDGDEISAIMQKFKKHNASGPIQGFH